MPASPLLVRFGALGDLVMAVPAMRALAARHGAPCDVVAHGAWSRALLANLPWVGQVACLDSRKLPYWLSPSQWRTAAFLRERRAAPAYLLEGDRTSAGLCARAGLVLTGSLNQAGHRDDEHQVDMNARACGVAGPDYDRIPTLAVTAAELAEARAWLTARGVTAAPVLVHPGNKRTQRRRSANHKEWPAERWIATMRAIRATGHPVLVTGTANEAAMCADLAASAGAASIAGQTPLRRLLALLKLAHSCVSVDTGPAHAAAALGCPLTVLFGRTDPRVNGPLGHGPVAIVTGPPDAPVLPGEAAWWQHHRMDAITTEAVVARWREIVANVAGQ